MRNQKYKCLEQARKMMNKLAVTGWQKREGGIE